ncbi:MAG: hypothetical protein QNK05_09375 [Myxococcota bacterium]|nr:hypothetical protein [Myxococcota bacterium]
MRRLIKLAAVAAILLLPNSVLALTNPVVSIVAPATANSGDTVNVDVVIDSDGLALAGYSFTVGFSVGGNTVGVISNPSVNTTLIQAGFIEDAFATRLLCPDATEPDCVGRDDAFFDLNQTSFAGEGVVNGVVETLTFQIDAANGQILEIIPFFRTGDSFGLANGACPPGDDGSGECDVTFLPGSIQIGMVATPEPGLALLFGSAGLGLMAVRRRV